MMDTHTDLCADGARDYSKPAVRDRIREYRGGTSDNAPTATFISHLAPSGCATWTTVPRYPSDHLSSLLIS